MIQLRFSFALGVLAGAVAFAQGPPPGHFGGGDFEYMHAHMGAQKLVKGAPYSAQAVSQYTQTLADGSHIQRSTTSSVARDSEGRTRREETIGAIGALAASTASPKAIFIHDPVAGSSYVLDPASKTGHVSQPRNFTLSSDAASASEPSARTAHVRSNAQVKTEELGTQTMDGLTVQGKRITRTIAAGQIGNEHQLQVVTEVWYSQDLQTTVMSTTTDPRTGVSTYKLSNISRAEPDASLFQVPADYKLTQGGGPRSHVRQ
jgi:hypothetical protein